MLDQTNAPVTPEILVPRLGEYLVESGALQPEGLRRGLEYQQKVSGERHLLIGQALLELGLIDRETLDRAITTQLMSYQKALRETNQQLEERVQQRTNDLEQRLTQIRTAAEVTQIGISAGNLSELFRQTVGLIVSRFGYYHASIFLVDESQEFAVLSEASGAMGKEMAAKGFRIEAGSQSMLGWVMTHKKPRVAEDVEKDPYFLKDGQLPDTRSEASIPMAIGEKLLGILDVQHTDTGAFDPEAVATLQTIANNIAAVMQNFHLLDIAQSNLNELTTLYQASHQMGRATSPNGVFQLAAISLKQSPYFTALFANERNGLRVITMPSAEPIGWGMPVKTVSYPEYISLTATELEAITKTGEGFRIANSILSSEQVRGIPEALLSVPRQAGYKSVAYILGRRAGKLEMLMVLGSRRDGAFSAEVLQPYISLVDITTTALEKVYASQRLEKRLAALQTLNTISQAVSVETDLDALYKVIHKEVVEMMGEVNFAIATYDPAAETITVPYMFDGQEVRRVEPFPLGEGLTSILIRTRQPLMLVEDTERKTRELGAIVVGKPAKSWLGVPLLVAGEVIGAILVQDLEQEGRFDEDDQSLLVTLASQVAAGIRNARLLEGTYSQATRERLLYTITNKIRTSPDVPGILETTARELGKALGARRATIELGIEPVLPPLRAAEEGAPAGEVVSRTVGSELPADPTGANE